MTKMTLGAYTFWRNPTRFTIPKQYKSYATVDTYSAVQFFSWGMFTAGQEILLEWEWMDSSAFASLQDLLDDDTQKTWDPKTGTTYTVEVLSLDGRYVESALIDADWRQDVKLKLLIRS
jgi:hypothetical protein